MQQLLYEGCKYLLGDDTLEVQQLPFHTLEVGTQVKSIGDTTSRSSHSRCDIFVSYATYEGVYTLKDGTKCLCFKIDLPAEQPSLYKLYEFNDQELYVPNYDYNSLRVYKPIFGLIHDGISCQMEEQVIR